MGKTAVAVCVLFVLAILAGGCGKKEEASYTTPEGEKVTVTKQGPGGATVEVKGKEGKTTITTEATETVTEEEAGVPIYPGVTVQNKGTMETGGEKVAQFVLTTTDSFDKVNEFYKSNLKGATNSYSGTSGDTQTSMYAVGEVTNPKASLMIARDKSKDETMISITRFLK